MRLTTVPCALLALAALAGCRTTGSAASLKEDEGFQGFNPECSQEIALVCEDGQEDSCINKPTVRPRKCIPKEGGGSGGGTFNPQCAQEIVLVCPDGQEDSCFKHNTSAPRRCVAKTWNGRWSSACMQEIAIQCPSGQVDSCTIDPSGARKCVSKQWTP